MNKYYITFGQIHVHSRGGRTFDKDSLAVIEAETSEEAHKIAMDIFDGKFHNVHTEKQLPGIIEYFPRGVIKI